jgi:hypothetical protein
MESGSIALCVLVESMELPADVWTVALDRFVELLHAHDSQLQYTAYNQNGFDEHALYWALSHHVHTYHLVCNVSPTLL